MFTQEALKYIEDYAVYSIAPEKAKELCDAFNVKMLLLARTEPGSREMDFKPGCARVDMFRLVASIAQQLHVEPDKGKMELSRKMLGIGSSIRLEVEAYLIPLKRMFISDGKFPSERPGFASKEGERNKEEKA